MENLSEVTIRFQRSFGAAAVHMRAAAVELVISLALLFYGLTIENKTRNEVLVVVILICTGLIYLAFGVILALTARATLSDVSIEYRNLLRHDVLALKDIDGIFLIDRWWASWAGGSLAWLEISSPCLVVKTRDGKQVKLLATVPVRDKSQRSRAISGWGLEYGFGEVKLRTRLSDWVDSQSESWHRRD